MHARFGCVHSGKDEMHFMQYTPLHSAKRSIPCFLRKVTGALHLKHPFVPCLLYMLPRQHHRRVAFQALNPFASQQKLRRGHKASHKPPVCKNRQSQESKSNKGMGCHFHSVSTAQPTL
eukprot:1148080-Pelagomonas_calceolata.AAC.4